MLQAKRDNDSVYFQHVPPAESLATIEPRRLVTPTPYALPAPALLVTEALLDAFVEVPAPKVGGLYATDPGEHKPPSKQLLGLLPCMRDTAALTSSGKGDN